MNIGHGIMKDDAGQHRIPAHFAAILEGHVPGAEIFLAFSASSVLYFSRLIMGAWKALATAQKARVTARRTIVET
jgi:hypothetical protein